MLIPIFIFTGSFLVYKNIYPEPRNWYDHYLHLARSLTQKRVDVPTLPSFYHDKIEFKGKTYIPFPPAPAMVLIPFMYLDRNVTQQQVSIIIGALNATLIYFLAKKYTSDLNAVLLSIFFAFGTVAFWTSVVGTTWNFAHTVANFFLLLSLICLVYFEKKYLMLVLSVTKIVFGSTGNIISGSIRVSLFQIYIPRNVSYVSIFQGKAGQASCEGGLCARQPCCWQNFHYGPIHVQECRRA